MKNEYGATLDRNGYAPSIIYGHSNTECWRCGRNGAGDPLNRHEIFGGAYRAKSKRLGLWVNLCHHSCHQGPDGVHNNRALEFLLRRAGQDAAMQAYGWDTARFIQEFGRNYL